MPYLWPPVSYVMYQGDIVLTSKESCNEQLRKCMCENDKITDIWK